jgi:hypothetical protein
MRMFLPAKSTALLCFAVILQAAAPSPEVDSALKSRVQEFYQLMVDHKFRQGEEMIAEDSKDFYYDSTKPDIKSFTIGKIEYSEDFRSAKVTIVSTVDILFPGAGVKRLNIPSVTNWKIDRDQWCWYVDKEALLQTPFGKVKPPSGNSKTNSGPLPTPITSLANAVTVDRPQIQLDSAHPKKEVVVLKNALPGPVTIVKGTPVPGINVSIAKPNLAASESTEVTISPIEGTSERPTSFALIVKPLNQKVSIEISWAAGQ